MQLSLDPIKFVETNFDLNGHPFTIIDNSLENSRHYMYGIYNTIAITMPKVQKPFVMVKGRQVEMSTTMANLIAYFTEIYPHFKTLYVCPALDQIKRFSGERFTPLLRYKHDPTILRPMKKVGEIEGTFTIKMKQFENGSTIYLEAISDDGNNIRNIAAELLIKDEYQDIPEDSEGNIDSVLAHSTYNMNVSLGTPKYTETQYERKWKASTQHYFFFVCPSCRHEYTLKMEHLVRGYEVQCPKCAHVEDKRILVRTGKWIQTQHSFTDDAGRTKEPTYIGYHLTQLLVPYKTKERIDQDIEEKRVAGLNIDKYVKNEILGEFYEGISQKPPLEKIERAFKADLSYNIYVPMTTRVYAGIDWGGWSVVDDDPTQSFTVYSSGFLTPEGKLRINYVEILDEQDELDKAKHAARLMEEQRVYLTVADSGYGKAQCLYLSSQFPKRFLKCKYIQGASNTFVDTAQEQEKGLIKANIDFTLEELYSAMQDNRMELARNQYTEWMLEHFMNYRVQLREQGNHTHKHFVKLKGKTKKVDAVHSLNFLRLAALHDTQGYKQSNMVLADKQLKYRSKAHPMLTGYTAADIEAMATQKRQIQLLKRSISRTMGE